MPEHFSFGLTGYPLGHSISPILHRAALDAAGLQGDYHLFEIPPLPDGEAALISLLQTLRRGDQHGLNVTIPHKQSLFPFLDDTTPAAQQIGAVNVVYCKDGCLIGDNTDAAGFLKDLERFLSEENRPAQSGRALVLGAGGSARAVVYALHTAGWVVTVAARRIEQAQILADEMGPEAVRSAHLDLSGIQTAGEIELLVNTTPVGMQPHTAASPWPENLPLPAGAAIYDLVYNPSHTKLIQAAAAAGLPACSGLGMLIEQAALSFERWTGHPANRAAMQQAARAALQVKGES
jgi:shikimate dehydrogenase